MGNGLNEAIGRVPVDVTGKLTITWGDLKEG